MSREDNRILKNIKTQIDRNASIEDSEQRTLEQMARQRLSRQMYQDGKKWYNEGYSLDDSPNKDNINFLRGFEAALKEANSMNEKNNKSR